MKTCTIDGCDKPHRARGLCATHYNQTRGPDRHKPVTKPCAACGKPCTRAGGGGRKFGQVCSESCRRDLTFGVSEQLPESHMARWAGQSMAVAYSTCEVCGLPIAHDARQQRRRHASCVAHRPRFVAGQCLECGSHFVADRMAFHGRAAYCSIDCGKAQHRRSRRRVDKRPGWRRIAELQGDMRCHICGDDCDPDDYERRADGSFAAGITYPSVDHIHPLARGGSNDLDNLALAHMLCNSWKSDTLVA